jgi:hypothetical protein
VDRIEVRLAPAPRLIRLAGVKIPRHEHPSLAYEARVSGPQRLLEIKLDGFRLDYRGTERQNSSLTVSLLTSN